MINFITFQLNKFTWSEACLTFQCLLWLFAGVQMACYWLIYMQGMIITWNCVRRSIILMSNYKSSNCWRKPQSIRHLHKKIQWQSNKIIKFLKGRCNTQLKLTVTYPAVTTEAQYPRRTPKIKSSRFTLCSRRTCKEFRKLFNSKKLWSHFPNFDFWQDPF